MEKAPEASADPHWAEECTQHLKGLTIHLNEDEVHGHCQEVSRQAGAARAIWLGILIDGVPESLVIGMLAASSAGAFLGTIVFPASPTGQWLYVVSAIEGLAAGAMLTMIAETMLPEAFEQGGAIVGISTLSGFLTALAIKLV